MDDEARDSPKALTVDLQKLLHFFDEAPASSRRHATAVVGVAGEDVGIALLSHYLAGCGWTVRALPGPCTQGSQAGVRLDRWIRAVKGRSARLYQVEVKNWSAHAIGGSRLPISATPRQVAQFKRDCWGQEWDGRTFRKGSVRKVLTPMRPPDPALPVHPLVCFWSALHPTGAKAPFFAQKVHKGKFRRVWVFSMSAYLRALGKRKLRLNMPETAKRLSWLTTLFGQVRPSTL